MRGSVRLLVGLHAVGAAGGEHLESDLHPAHRALERAQRGRDFARGLGIEDEDEIARHRE